MAVLDESACAARLRSALDGDEVAYREFLREITPVMRGIVHARLPSLDSASHEDVLQEVLLAVHAKRHTWRREAPVLPWLYAICRYKCIDALRGSRRRANEVDVDSIEPLHAPDTGIEEALELRNAIAQLDGRLREVVKALTVEGLDVAATAEKLAMNENAVRVAFHRALSRLKTLTQENENVSTGAANANR